MVNKREIILLQILRVCFVRFQVMEDIYCDLRIWASHPVNKFLFRLYPTTSELWGMNEQTQKTPEKKSLLKPLSKSPSRSSKKRASDIENKYVEGKIYIF